MSEISHLSLSSSSLYNSSIAGQSSDKDEYIYSMPKSSCNKFPDRFHIQKINNCDWDSTTSVEIASYGILRRLIVKFEIQIKGTNVGSTGGADDRPPLIARGLFARMIKRADLMNSSRVILSLFDDVIQYLVYQMPEEKSKAYRLAGLDNTLFGAGLNMHYTDHSYHNLASSINSATGATNTWQKSIFVFCPLPFSCFEMGGAGHPSKSCLDTRFLERLSVSLTIGKKDDCVYYRDGDKYTGTTGEVNIKNAWLLSDFDIIKQSELDQIEKANFATSSPLAQVFSNWEKVDHAFTATGTATLNAAGFYETTMNLYNTQLVHSMVVVLRKVPNITDTKAIALLCSGAGVFPKTSNLTQGTPTDCSVYGNDFKTIHELELSSSGRTLYKAGSDIEALALTNNEGAGNPWFDLAESSLGGTFTATTANGGAAHANATGQQSIGLGVLERASMVDINGASKCNFYVIPFCNDCYKTNGINGALAMKNLNSVTLRVKTRHVDGKNYVLSCYVRYYQAIATESNSGRIQVSISN